MPHLVWVYDGSLSRKLDAATWLKPTEELRNLGWRVTLVVVGPAGHRCIDGVAVFCIQRPDVYFLRRVVFVMKFLYFLIGQWNTVDVILFHEMSAYGLLPLRFIRSLTGKRRPLLVMDTRTLPMEPEEKADLKTRLRWIFRNLMTQLGNHYADGRLTITERMAEALHIPPNQLWGVWPSGVDLAQFAPALKARHWPLPGESIHLVYIGCLHYERNLMALSQAVTKANADGMMFTLLLVGDGTERADLERYAVQTAGRVRVVLPLPHAQMPEVLAQAHVGALPFPDEEKFRVSSPIKLFEYMAAGLPILATRIACHTDVLEQVDCVFWAENADVAGLLASLRTIWQAQDLLSGMGHRAASAAQARTWRESATRLKAALERGLAEKW